LFFLKATPLFGLAKRTPQKYVSVLFLNRPTIQLLPNDLVTESAEPGGFDEETRGDPPFHLKRKKCTAHNNITDV
jgi:hypothetical protein